MFADVLKLFKIYLFFCDSEVLDNNVVGNYMLL